MNGWPMSPVHKSEIANPLRRIWNGVLKNVFLQIAAKINAFPTTATGEETAINKAAEKVSALEYDAFVRLSAAEPRQEKCLLLRVIVAGHVLLFGHQCQ